MAGNESPTKRQKQAHRNSVSSENSDEGMKITDLNPDCLEKILDRLDSHDFLHIALSNKVLQLAAVSSYKRKYGNKKIIADPTNHASIYMHENEIRIAGLKLCLQFIRCFGEHITDLTVCSNSFLNRYIEQYCIKTLTKISLKYGHFSVNSFRKPFKHVNVVEIAHIDPSKLFICFAFWFPNMHQLEIVRGNISNNRFVELRFPKLEQITLSLGTQKTEVYATIMRANPQLKTIIFSHQDRAMQRALITTKHNASILKLQIFRGCTYRTTHLNDLQRLVREHPLLVELDLTKHQLNAEGVIFLIRHLNALKLLRFAVNDPSDYHNIVNHLDNEWRHEMMNDLDWPYIVKLSRVE